MLVALNILMQNTLLHAFVRTAGLPCLGKFRGAKTLLFQWAHSMMIQALNPNKIYSGARRRHGLRHPRSSYLDMKGFQ